MDSASIMGLAILHPLSITSHGRHWIRAGKLVEALVEGIELQVPCQASAEDHAVRIIRTGGPEKPQRTPAEILVFQDEGLIDLQVIERLDDGLLGQGVTALQHPDRLDLDDEGYENLFRPLAKARAASTSAGWSGSSTRIRTSTLVSTAITRPPGA
jgi:hypothetical protein